LLSSLFGETFKFNGHINLNGSIAYVSQQAWLQNTTLKDNILFGKHFNENYYKQVVSACALESDISILPSGDSTEIGEKV
jgi:ABC-type multidrug transport system fused ATPase/permease subunit